jgi:hypothetical protein
MTIEEISKYASTGNMPDQMTCPERCLFYSLRDLYAMHKENRITRTQGEKMKQEIVKRYMDDVRVYGFADKYIKHNARLWKEIEEAGSKYRKEPSIENADAFLEAVYGVGRLKTEERGERGDVE